MEEEKKYEKPSNRRIKKAKLQFENKLVKTALRLIEDCSIGVVEGEFISDTDTPGLDDCLVFLLEGQR